MRPTRLLFLLIIAAGLSGLGHLAVLSAPFNASFTKNSPHAGELLTYNELGADRPAWSDPLVGLGPSSGNAEGPAEPAVSAFLPMSCDTQPNPIIGLINDPGNTIDGEVVICPNDGDPLPKIFLCGFNDAEPLLVDIPGAVTIQWERLNEGSCPPILEDCANKNSSCGWDSVGSGDTFEINQAGEFRLVVNFDDGCLKRYYFNVYKNPLEPQYTYDDLVCGAPGNITVTNMPSDYEYQLLNADTGGVLVPFSAANGPSFDIAAAGNYTVEIRQEGVTGGCLFFLDNIAIAEQNVAVNITTTEAGCTGLGDLSISITEGEPQFTYQIARGGTLVDVYGPAAETSYSFSSLSPGTYDVTVSLENGCVYSGQATVADSSDLELSARVSQHITCKEGNILMESDGGKTPHTYAIWEYIDENGIAQISYPTPDDIPQSAFQTSQIFDIWDPGQYTFVVVDRFGCFDISNPVVIYFVPPVEYVLGSIWDVECFGASDGAIIYDVLNRNGYQLAFNLYDENNVLISSNSSGYFTGLPPGDYMVHLNFRKGGASCDFYENYTIDGPDSAVTGDLALIQDYSCLQDGVVEVQNAGGGTAPYEYSIDGVNYVSGPGAEIFSGLQPGTYTVTMRDANGCVAETNPIDINPVDPPSDITFANSNLSCEDLTSDLQATIVGGTWPLTVEIIAPSPATADAVNGGVADFIGLSPGTYTFRVTDANGCVYTESHTIPFVAPIQVSGSLVRNISCFGETDGAAVFTVNSFASTYSYSINGAAPVTGQTSGSILLNNLAPGDHEIIVTDEATGCTDTATVTVAGPVSPLAFTFDLLAPSCVSDAAATINPSGGWGGYAYEIEQPDGSVLGPQSGRTFAGLSQPGTYTITVRDSGGCEITDTFEVQAVTPPVAGVDPASNLCYEAGSPATVVIAATNGTAPYFYNVNGGPFQSSNTFSGLLPGSYTFAVIDANGCTDDVSLTIADQLAGNALLTKDFDCSISPDAVIGLSLVGGTGPFAYEVNINGSGFVPYAGGFPYTATSAGTYQFRVTDSLGCATETNIITTTPAVDPQAVATTIDPTCFGDANGIVEIEIDPNFGQAPYQVDFNGSGYSSQTVYAGLPAGTYSYAVQDSKGCTFTDTVTLSEPAFFDADVVATDMSCSPGGDVPGQISVSITSGGVPNFTYALYDLRNNIVPTTGPNPIVNTSSTTATFDGLGFGDYYVRIFDANGCEYYESPVRVLASPFLTLASNSIADCISGGTVELTADSGSGNYSFEIFGPGTGPDFTTPGSGTEVIATYTGLNPGQTYVFRAVDLNTNCSSIIEVTIDTLSAIDVVASPSVSDVTCFGDADGSIAFQLEGYDPGVTTLSYTILEALTNNPTGFGGTIAGAGGAPTALETVTGLGAGDYVLLFEEDQVPSCSGTFPFRILEPAPIQLSIIDVNNANCADLAQVTVRATGGSRSFAYAFVPDGAAPAPGDFQASGYAELNPATATDWDVYAQDSNGCLAGPIDLAITTDPEPVISLLASNSCTATEGGFDLVVTLDSAGIGPYSLSLDGGAYQASSLAGAGDSITYSGLLSGSHTVSVRDANGCAYTASIDIEVPLGVGALVSAQPGCAGGDGEIIVTALGGSGSYAYDLLDGSNASITGGAAQASNIFTGLFADSYTAVVIDAVTGCTLQTVAPVVLEPATPVTFEPHTIVDVSCDGASDGAVRVSLTPAGPGVNDNPPYTYTLYDAGGTLLVGPQSDPWFTGLPAGDYQVEALSGRGCSLREPITITAPPPVSLTASATEFACSPDNLPSLSLITANAAGGSGSYMYSIDGANYIPQNTFTVADTGLAQTITVYARDTSGCVATEDVNIEPLNTFDVAVSQNIAISCINPEQVLLTVADNGDASNVYSFELLPAGNPNGALVGNPAYNQAVFELSAPDSYTFRVTDTATGCFVETTYQIAPFDLIEITAAAASPATCFGYADGSATVSVSGYAGAYTYEVIRWDGTATGIAGSGDTASNPLIVNNLPGGSYYIRITETGQPYCGGESNVFPIDSPPSALAGTVAQVADVTCTNDQGEILVTATGGYPAYDIVLTETGSGQAFMVSNQTSHVFGGLSAGTYAVEVTDAQGCVFTDTITLVEPAPIVAGILATPASLACYGDSNATVSAVGVSGGEGNYLYQLNYYDASGSVIEFSTGFQPSPDFENLGAGIYSITVADSWNCDLETPQVVITGAEEVVASLVQSVAMTCTSGAGLILSASGGTGPYEYSPDGVNFFPMGGGDTHAFSVPGGDYQYYVRDSFGCEASISNQVRIEPVPELTLAINNSAANVNCAGETTAFILATATGGLGNYMFELYADAALSNMVAGPQPEGEFGGLGTGSYWVRVISEDCEAVSGEIVVAEPAPLQVDRAESTDITCLGADDGSIAVEVSGGTGTILYAISPNLDKFDVLNTFTNLAPGTYDIIAQDQLGCFMTFQFTIGEPEALSIEAASSPEICAGSADGTIEVLIGGGSAPYSTSLNSTSPADYVQGQTVFTGLPSGTYVIFVRDAQGCENSVIVEVDPGANLNAAVTPVYECTGNAPDNYLDVTLEDSAVAGEVMYGLDTTDPSGMQLEANFSGLAPGPHYLAVSHSNGCVLTIDFEIESYEPLSLALEQQNINEITAIASGGVPPYTFYFNGDDTGADNTYNITGSGVYTVQVVDQLGCVAEAQIEMEFVDIEIPNYFTPDGDGNNDFWIPNNLEGYQEILIKIYDRYGRVVAELSYGVQGWDGTYDGKALPTGDYWYVIRLNGERDQREFVGHFTLYR